MLFGRLERLKRLNSLFFFWYKLDDWFQNNNGDIMKKTSISFGLVNIPVEMNPVIKNNDINFNQLHKKCLSRIKYVKYCPHCKKDVKQNDIIRGYEFKKDDYVTLTNEEFNKLKAEDEKTIEIIGFVNLNEIDPIYFEKSYVLKTNSKIANAWEVLALKLRSNSFIVLTPLLIINCNCSFK